MIQEEGEVQVIEFTSSLILKSYFRTDCVPFIVKYPKAYYFVSATVDTSRSLASRHYSVSQLE